MKKYNLTEMFIVCLYNNQSTIVKKKKKLVVSKHLHIWDVFEKKCIISFLLSEKLQPIFLIAHSNLSRIDWRI